MLHYFLKIADLDRLQIHPVAGFSFESFVIEELIRGLQATMVTQLEYAYYRTIGKAEVDLVVEGPFGIIPFEIKLNSLVKRISLRVRIPLIPASDSSRSRSPIPHDPGQPFQMMAAR